MIAPMDLWIDSDNALGSPAGDVDDAYAIAALIRGGAPVLALSSCAGNTTEERALSNHRRLAAILKWNGRVVGASQARTSLATFPGRIVALGPCTNLIEARKAVEVIVVGSNSASRGRWPPIWPFEFNLTHDRPAARALFRSELPLTLFPLNLARQLWATAEEVERLEGSAGEFLRSGSKRWFAHLRRVRMTGRFPIYDLAAAMYALGEDGFAFEQTTSAMSENTWIDFNSGSRPVKVCTAIDRPRVWRRFVEIFNGESAPLSSTLSS